MFADPQNDFTVRGRTLISITERWTSNNERLSVTAWVKNLTNKYYNTSSTLSEHLGQTGLPGAPRTYGLTLGYRY
jgi:iron complex outermembrane receptor protein